MFGTGYKVVLISFGGNYVPIFDYGIKKSNRKVIRVCIIVHVIVYMGN